MISTTRARARWPLVAALAGSCFAAALAGSGAAAELAPPAGGRPRGRSTATLKQIYVGNTGTGAGSSSNSLYIFSVDDARFKGFAVMNGEGLLVAVDIYVGKMRIRVTELGAVGVPDSGQNYVERHRGPFAQGGAGEGFVKRVGDVTFDYYTSMTDRRFMQLERITVGGRKLEVDYWYDPARKKSLLSRVNDFDILRFDYKGPGAGGYRAGRIGLLGNAALDYDHAGGYRSGRVSEIALLQEPGLSPLLVDYYHDAGPRSGRLRSYTTKPKGVTMTVDYDGAPSPRINKVTGPTRIAGVEIIIQGINDGTTTSAVDAPEGLVEIHVMNRFLERLWAGGRPGAWHFVEGSNAGMPSYIRCFFECYVDRSRGLSGSTIVFGDGIVGFVTFGLGDHVLRVWGQGQLSILGKGPDGTLNEITLNQPLVTCPPFQAAPSTPAPPATPVGEMHGIEFEYYTEGWQSQRVRRIREKGSGGVDITCLYWRDTGDGTGRLSQIGDTKLWYFPYEGLDRGGYRAGRLQRIDDSRLDYFHDGGYRSGYVRFIELARRTPRFLFFDYWHDGGARSGRLSRIGEVKFGYTEIEPTGARSPFNFINKVDGPRPKTVRIVVEGAPDPKERQTKPKPEPTPEPVRLRYRVTIAGERQPALEKRQGKWDARNPYLGTNTYYVLVRYDAHNVTLWIVHRHQTKGRYSGGKFTLEGKEWGQHVQGTWDDCVRAANDFKLREEKRYYTPPAAGVRPQ